MTLRDILVQIARLTGRAPPRIRLPRAPLIPVAYVAELAARLTGGSTRITVEGLRMAGKRMFFSSQKAQRELGYAWRPPIAAFQDALAWADAQGLLRARG
jgi:dihydroflavonol-4-reductase